METLTLEKPRYRFSNKKGEHLHLLDDRPLTGTSSIGNVLAKNLVWWAAELAAVECLEAGARIPTIREEYLLACAHPDKKQAIDELQKKYPIFKKARFAHFDSKKKAAEKGTDLHKILEDFVKFEMGLRKTWKDDDKIMPFVEWSNNNVKQFHASEANCYSERLWLGGQLDAVAELNDGSLAVIDFKSSKEAYPSQFIQTCLYAIQINENGLWDSSGNHNKKLDKLIDKLMIVPFGAEKVVPEIRNAKDYVAGAEAAVTLYRMLGFSEKQKELNN